MAYQSTARAKKDLAGHPEEEGNGRRRSTKSTRQNGRQKGLTKDGTDSAAEHSADNRAPSDEPHSDGASDDVCVRQNETSSSSDKNEDGGVSDLEFGSRSQPIRYSRATRYHMLLEVAQERSRQRMERAKSSGKSTTLRVKKTRQVASSCALLYGDPLATSSDESDDDDWDPTAVYGEAARRRLKSRYSETESDSEESGEEGCDEAEESGQSEAVQNADTKSSNKPSKRSDSISVDNKTAGDKPARVTGAHSRNSKTRTQSSHTEQSLAGAACASKANETDASSVNTEASSSSDVSVRPARKSCPTAKPEAAGSAPKATKVRDTHRLSAKRARVERN